MRSRRLQVYALVPLVSGGWKSLQPTVRSRNPEKVQRSGPSQHKARVRWLHGADQRDPAMRDDQMQSDELRMVWLAGVERVHCILRWWHEAPQPVHQSCTNWRCSSMQT